LQDVAQKAGVSMKTVSRVVNKEKNVAEETRTRVLQTIQEMGYVPHVQAQRLASGRTRSIVLHFPLTNPELFSNLVGMDFITGVAQSVAEEEYYFSMITEPLTPGSLMKLCRGAQADGLILMQIAMQDWRVEFLRENGFPFVMVGRCGNNDGLSFIDHDPENAIMEAYAHLTSLGHQHIGFLTYPEEWRDQGVAERIWQGFEAAQKEFKVDSQFRECQQTVERAYWATKSLLKENPRITAIVTIHNTQAVGAITAVQEMGRKVPDDCSIVGVLVGEGSDLITPALTSIQYSSHYIGHQVAAMLIRKLKGTSPGPEQILVPLKLKLRGSTAPAPR
jgi:DNA-binding LacI/PurR family transcriptional regulator